MNGEKRSVAGILSVSDTFARISWNIKMFEYVYDLKENE